MFKRLLFLMVLSVILASAQSYTLTFAVDASQSHVHWNSGSPRRRWVIQFVQLEYRWSRDSIYQHRLRGRTAASRHQFG